MRFKKGQQIVCIKRDHWKLLDGSLSPNPCPKYNEQVTCDGYFGDCLLYLEEYDIYTDRGHRMRYSDANFAPLADISEQTEILKHETQEV